jgi:hypothetical protein
MPIVLKDWAAKAATTRENVGLDLHFNSKLMAEQINVFLGSIVFEDLQKITGKIAPRV